MSERAGKTGERAKHLRKEAERWFEEADGLREEAKEADAKGAALEAKAEEAERDEPEADAAWAEMQAIRRDKRQIALPLVRLCGDGRGERG